MYSLKGHDLWLSLPDMNPCDFWLWWDLKDKVFKPPPNILNQLKLSIRRHIPKLPADIIQRAVMNMKKKNKAGLLVQNQGKALEGRERKSDCDH